MGVALGSAILGVLLGAVSFRIKVLDYLLAPLITLIKNAPVACVIVLLLVSLGSQGATAAIVVFVALPPFFVAIQEALNNQPYETHQVLKSGGISSPLIFLALTWPASLPYFRTASKTAISLSWRAGITGELLGLPLGSIGSAIYVSKLTLDTPMLLSLTLMVMLCGWLCEKAVLALLELTERAPHLAIFLQRARHAQQKQSSRNSAVNVARVEISHVSKSYAGKLVLDNESLILNTTDRVCLMAPTGAGKTTLLRILLGYEQPDTGTVRRPNLCIPTMQSATVIESLTALDNILLCAAPDRTEKEIQTALDKLLPNDCLPKPLRELSGGTRRLVEIARSLYAPGSIVVLDEPFAGLDPKTHAKACQFINEQLQGRSLIFTTHDAADAVNLNANIVRINS